VTALRHRPAPRRRWKARSLAIAIAVLVAFVGGIGLGEALHDNPTPGGTQTLIQTLHPRSLVPIVQSTVTITTSNP
jgi:hypothetical protein